MAVVDGNYLEWFYWASNRFRVHCRRVLGYIEILWINLTKLPALPESQLVATKPLHSFVSICSPNIFTFIQKLSRQFHVNSAVIFWEVWLNFTILLSRYDIYSFANYLQFGIKIITQYCYNYTKKKFKWKGRKYCFMQKSEL